MFNTNAAYLLCNLLLWSICRRRFNSVVSTVCRENPDTNWHIQYGWGAIEYLSAVICFKPSRGAAILLGASLPMAIGKWLLPVVLGLGLAPFAIADVCNHGWHALLRERSTAATLVFLGLASVIGMAVVLGDTLLFLHRRAEQRDKGEPLHGYLSIKGSPRW